MSSRRYKHVSIEDDNGDKIDLRLRKWSVSKFMSILSDIGDIAKSLGSEFGKDEDPTAAELVSMIVQLGGEAFDRVIRIVVESVDDKKITTDKAKAWDLETFVTVLGAIIDMNFTDGLVKNFKSLREVVESRLGKVLGAKPPKAEEAPIAEVQQ